MLRQTDRQITSVLICIRKNSARRSLSGGGRALFDYQEMR